MAIASTDFVPFTSDQIEQSLATRFEQQVVRHPEHLALGDDTIPLTYSALNAAANGMARALHAHLGAQPQPVALLLDQGVTAIVSLLGVLKAGHFYIPLDPAHPEARLRAILNDLGNPSLITLGAHLPLAEQLTGGSSSILNSEDLPPDNSDLSAGPPASPEDLAYVYYTSGSTGEPKGVMQRQRNVLHFIMASTNEMQIMATDASSMMSYFGTAAAVSDIFGALLNSAALHPYDLRRSGLAPLGDWLDNRSITLFHCVPTVLRHLGRQLGPTRRFPQVRIVRLGGEPVARRDVDIFRRHFTDDCRLGVSYGSTERNVIRRFWIDTETCFTGHVAPIGYATVDVEAFVADENLQPLPEGEAGQIIVRSAYLSPGYWKRPELTAQVFRPDPDGGDRRLYLTGDLGRRAPGDCLYHLGRIDAQVKIRGHRVELMEIEAALLSLPMVTEAAVTAVENETGDKRLVAYVVLTNDSLFDPQVLRTALAQSLPVHMLPGTFVSLEALPLLPGGKVNRLALPEMPPAPLRKAARSPRSDVEARLLAIWREVLDNPDLGPEDDFFNLGGDSLQVVALMTAIRLAYAVELPPNTLLQYPTVAAMSELLPTVTAATVPHAEGIFSYQLEGNRHNSFWFPGGVAEEEGLLRCTMLGRALGPEWPFHILDVRHLALEVEATSELTDLAHECVRRIKALQADGPYLLGGLCAGGLIAYETARQLKIHGDEVVALVLRDTVCPGTALAARQRKHLLQKFRDTLGELQKQPNGERWGYLLHNAATALKLLADRHTPAGRARSHYRELLRSYRPQPYPGRVLLLVSESWQATEATLGWSQSELADLQVRPIPGRHDTWDRRQTEASARYVRDYFELMLSEY